MVINHVMLRMNVVTRMVVTAVMVLVVCGSVVVVLLLRRLPLGVFLILHPPVLEPNFHLSLGQVQVSRELPTLLLRNVRVEKKLFF